MRSIRTTTKTTTTTKRNHITARSVRRRCVERVYIIRRRNWARVGVGAESVLRRWLPISLSEMWVVWKTGKHFPRRVFPRRKIPWPSLSVVSRCATDQSCGGRVRSRRFFRVLRGWSACCVCWSVLSSNSQGKTSYLEHGLDGTVGEPHRKREIVCYNKKKVRISIFSLLCWYLSEDIVFFLYCSRLIVVGR